MKFSLERNEIRIIFLFGFLAWFFSRKQFIMFIQGLDPIQTIILYYAILLGLMHFMLKGSGISIGGFQVERWGGLQSVGALAFIIGIQLAMNWNNSQWSSLALGGSGDLPIILFGNAPDGVLFWLWWNYLKVNVTFPYMFWSDPAQMAADLTYPVGVFIMLLIAFILLDEKRLRRILGGK